MTELNIYDINSLAIIREKSFKANGVGLLGVHRTGKTTYLQNSSSIDFIKAPTSSKDVIDKVCHSFSNAEKLSLAERLKLQSYMLINAYTTWEKASKQAEDKNKRFITDRTPIDFLAYTYLINFIKRDEETEESNKLIREIRDTSIMLMGMLKSLVYFKVKYRGISELDAGYFYSTSPYPIEVFKETAPMKDSYRFILDSIYLNILNNVPSSLSIETVNN